LLSHDPAGYRRRGRTAERGGANVKPRLQKSARGAAAPTIGANLFNIE
jgi:hypothetical protein